MKALLMKLKKQRPRRRRNLQLTTMPRLPLPSLPLLRAFPRAPARASLPRCHRRRTRHLCPPPPPPLRARCRGHCRCLGRSRNRKQSLRRSRRLLRLPLARSSRGPRRGFARLKLSLLPAVSHRLRTSKRCWAVSPRQCRPPRLRRRHLLLPFPSRPRLRLAVVLGARARLQCLA
jgi:hypothetical protein